MVLGICLQLLHVMYCAQPFEHSGWGCGETTPGSAQGYSWLCAQGSGISTGRLGGLNLGWPELASQTYLTQWLLGHI